METTILNVIDKNTKYLMKEIAEIKRHVADMDYILTYDDMASPNEAENELKEGKTK
ncbi:MAG: hypothetical protein QMD06_03840 [Candidatus Altarchaeum sp.]|nr:hypothetical protein [Candidatus Altarchaeum sp.]